jgi:hypothetical protein
MLARSSCPLSMAALALGSLLAAGCSKEPFALVKVSGRITYEDGTLIPAEGNFVRLMFYPEAPSLDSKTHPRPGAADVDLRDGSFSLATTHRWGDGLTVGRHKVVICGWILSEVPKGVRPEYNDMTKSLLEVDTSKQPFVLKIRKP